MTQLDTALWRDMMTYLRDRHAPICRQWFEDLEPVGIDSGTIHIRTPTPVQKNYLQKKCVDQFQEAAQSTTGALVSIRFVTSEDVDQIGSPRHNGRGHEPATIDPEADTSDTQGARDDPEAAGGTATLAPQRGEPIEFDQIVISPDYRFDNFVSGPGNQLAYAAAIAVANQPGTAYNPLFIHGGVGLGKTHLLQAIAQTILHDKANAQICYVSCESFVNQFLDCVQRGKMSDFRHRYRHVDILLIDDIHFLAGRERTQEEFFHTFNELYQSGRQIVLSSDAAPAEIPQLEERLVSRFQSGLVAHITKPDYETRVAIVRAKAQLRGLELSNDVVSLIASKIESNARELEGAITTLQGHSALQNRAIDTALVREVLGDIEGGVAQVTLQHIIDAVTRYYNVKLSDLQSKRRHKSITGPRQVCMWLARRHTRFSLEEIGGYFGGRDHTTVMHSIRTVDDRIEIDTTFKREVDQIEGQVQRG